MRKRQLLAALVLAVFTAVSLAGCGERADKETETETAKKQETEAVTEVPTEAITEPETEAPTEPPTEPPTEAITEPETEAPTEPQFPDDMTGEEEAEYESEFKEKEIYFAVDDINVRSTPTIDEDNIIGSFDQGEKVSVIGETPHWYAVEKDEGTGYVRKDVLSEEEVAPKTEEERADANNSSSGESVEHSVSAYAESFTIQLGSDANLRSKPDELGEIIGTVKADTILTTTGETGDWYQVEVDGTVGYINKNLVK